MTVISYKDSVILFAEELVSKARVSRCRIQVGSGVGMAGHMERNQPVRRPCQLCGSGSKALLAGTELLGFT